MYIMYMVGTVYDVYCIVYTVHGTVYNIKCTMYIAHIIPSYEVHNAILIKLHYIKTKH